MELSGYRRAHRMTNGNRMAFRASVPLFLLLLVASLASAGENLLRNGELTNGAAGLPSDWVPLNLRPKHAKEIFSWIREPTGSGELRVDQPGADFAQWGQTVNLTPGWYQLSGEVRAEKLGAAPDAPVFGIRVTGGSFGWLIPQAGGSSWQRADFYFRVGDPGAEVQVVCQLAGSKGAVSFRHLSMTRMTAPPPPGARQVDLQSVQISRAKARELAFRAKPFQSSNRGSLWTLWALMLSIAAVIGWGWFAMGQPEVGRGSSGAHN